MYSLLKFCYCCLSADGHLKSFSTLHNDNLTILNCTFSAVWTRSTNMFICTDCDYNLQKTCDFLNKCRKNCKLLKGYIRKLNQNDTTRALVDLTVTISDYRKQVYELKSNDTICDDRNTQDCITNCEENVVNSEFGKECSSINAMFDSEACNKQNGVEIKIEPDLTDLIHIKVEIPDDMIVDLNSSIAVKEEGNEFNFAEECLLDNVPVSIEDQICETVEDNKVKIKTVRKNTKKKNFSCCLCCLKFRQRDALISHLLIHKQSRKISQKTTGFYQCSLCNRSYRQKDSFINHYLFHQGYKPFKCSTCEKIFNERSELAMHMKTNCLAINERPYECRTCHSAFKRRAHLIRHELLHSSLRKYNMCDRCGTQFVNKALLNRHMLCECKEEMKLVTAT